MMKPVVMCIAATILLMSGCSPVVASEDKIQRCGSQLTDILRILCEGQYFQPQDGGNRRSVRASLPAFGSVTGWLLSRRMVGGLDASEGVPEYRGRQTRGVVDECCRKSCSYYDLLQYCA